MKRPRLPFLERRRTAEAQAAGPVRGAESDDRVMVASGGAGRRGAGEQRPGEQRSGEQGTRKRRRRRGGGEPTVVPEAEFTSYYGRPIVKAPPWAVDVPVYLFAGGLAAGSSLLAAGASLTDRPTLRRVGRLTSLGGLVVTLVALVHDLGRPARFLNMLRTVKLTSPMSVGSWILSGYAAPASLAAVAEITRMLPEQVRELPPARLLKVLDTPAGVAAGVLAPPVAAYTAVLLSDTAMPAWHDAYKELPFVFVSSAAVAAGGMGMLAAPVAEAGPARRMAVLGAAVELATEQQMERSMGLTAETLHQGRPGKLMLAAKVLTVGGGIGALFAGRSRAVAALSGVALMAASACTRLGIFGAGMASAEDPKYVVVPQRERLEREGPVRAHAPTDAAGAAPTGGAATGSTAASGASNNGSVSSARTTESS